MVKNRSISEKMFLRALSPAMFLMVTIWGAVFIDGVIVCRLLGSNENAAIGLVYPVIVLVQMFAGCISSGVQIFSSRKLGSGETEQVKDIFAEMYTLSVIVSVSLTVLVICFADPLAVFLGASKDAAVIRKATADYIRGYAIGIPAVMLNVLFRVGMQLSDGKRNLMAANVAFLLTDTVLDLAAVFCGLGTFGVGAASGLSYYVSLLFFAVFIRKNNTLMTLSFRRIRRKSVATVAALGSGDLLKRSISVVRPLLLNRLIVFYGGMTSLSALYIQNNVTGMLYIPGNAVMTALSIVAGVFYAENNEEELYRICDFCRRFVWLITGCLAAALALFSVGIARFYATGDADLQKLMVFVLLCTAVQLPFNTLDNVRLSYLRATLQTKKALVYTFVYTLILQILSVWAFAAADGGRGAFVGLLAADLIMPVLVRLYYVVKHRKLRLTRRECSGLPDSFFLSPDDRLFAEVGSLAECPLVSEQAALFCRRHGMGPNMVYRVALCIEEWCKNIIEWGYGTNPGAVCHITVFLKLQGENLVIYIKDIAPKFNPAEYMESIGETARKDVTKNIGIRLIQNSAKDVRYTRLLDTNIIIFVV